MSLFYLFFFPSDLFSTFCYLAGFVQVAEQCGFRVKISTQLNSILRCLICTLVPNHWVSEKKIYLLFLWHKSLFYLLCLAPQQGETWPDLSTGSTGRKLNKKPFNVIKDKALGSSPPWLMLLITVPYVRKNKKLRETKALLKFMNCSNTHPSPFFIILRSSLASPLACKLLCAQLCCAQVLFTSFILHK